MPATPISLAYAATPLALPADLEWVDEFAWQPVTQAIEYSLSGALIVDVGTRQAGRPITLAGTDERCLLRRAALDQINTWAALPGAVLRLTLRGVARDVVFRHQDGAVDARQLVAGAPIDTDGGGLYAVTLKFMEL